MAAREQLHSDPALMWISLEHPMASAHDLIPLAGHATSARNACFTALQQKNISKSAADVQSSPY
jgi:hypothetical protein